MSVSKAVLITGCSSGIGWSTAKRLSDVGWRVYATARNVEKIAPLEASGCRLLPLDVTDEDSMASAVEEVEREEGAVGALVNNAGYSQSGAVETVPMEKVRAQFETNVFGLARMCQLALPGMRRQGYGRIVNVSSTLGVEGCVLFTGSLPAQVGLLYRVLSLHDAAHHPGAAHHCPTSRSREDLRK